MKCTFFGEMKETPSVKLLFAWTWRHDENVKGEWKQVWRWCMCGNIRWGHIFLDLESEHRTIRWRCYKASVLVVQVEIWYNRCDMTWQGCRCTDCKWGNPCLDLGTGWKSEVCTKTSMRVVVQVRMGIWEQDEKLKCKNKCDGGGAGAGGENCAWSWKQDKKLKCTWNKWAGVQVQGWQRRKSVPGPVVRMLRGGRGSTSLATRLLLLLLPTGFTLA